ncbi:glucose-6-phosphate dehydrogenase [Seohaeicola zhoushanensis]|uniref:Glucose-6-phosphate 1-dehydrogenase n=1 Tax=Seohaeicola zhoushanensis TaxID=1569283 RepID=A0A8J3M672_9RHOB|nr:glucose-6-phosphate dehydrogenase [Seohaeicola zhoushanensis]GHF46063.1 glucose-6-phosphate 1-dehydrogenase [Seohaeicola zhoushanensis]
MVSRVIPVDPFDLVIFGGTGDLARRKILPALFRRYCAGQIPPEAVIIGAARADYDASGYRDFAAEAIREFAPGRSCEDGTLGQFLDRLDFVTLDARGDTGWGDLAARLQQGRVRAFYFSVGPGLFGDLAERLHKWGVADPDSRIVVEKPFGHDLATARELNQTLAAHFQESQIYRIDHYLGKETVQNLMAVRFGNMLFEPLWNAQYVDHIQITVAETVGVGGRGEYYDTAGAMRDMMQNHLMQLLCLIAMEPPARFEPDAVRDEKLKVIRALDDVLPHHIVRGQYDAQQGAENAHPSYREAVGNPRSKTESYIALKTHVSNWRWAGTPFYLRTGKRLKARSSVISVMFKETPHSIFGAEAGRHANVLTIRLQPNEGITLQVTIKEPGPGGMRLVDVPLDMTFAEALGPEGSDPPDAYERLIMDVIRGNQTLFMRGDEVEAAWAWTDPIIAGWVRRGEVPKPYDSGSTGPGDADLLMQRDGREWRGIVP